MKNITLYAYLDISKPMVAWEVAIGRIKSNTIDNSDNFGVSFWQYELFHKYSSAGLYKYLYDEFRIERIRKQFFPKQVSRIQGLYFFETESMAKRALNNWNMRDKVKYLSEVTVSYDSITRVDSEWITKYFGEKDNDDWIYKYWNGTTMGRNPLTEVLVNGIGIVKNYELRVKAYKKIYNQFPLSTSLLASAMCGFSIYNLVDLALIKPAILKKDNTLVGNYYIYMDEFDLNQKEITEAVEICKKNMQFPSIIMPEGKDTFFSLPNFSESSFLIDNKKLVKSFKEYIIDKN